MITKKTITNAFIEHFDGKPKLIVRAPGRVNLIGEHTDYNNGFVMPMAIDRAVWIALRPRSDEQVIIHSLDFNETRTFNLDDLKKDSGKSWIEYPQAAAWAMQNEGMLLKGWEGVMEGDIPIGAGLSSSAAVIMAVIRTFAEASKLRWDPVFAAQLGLKAENEWIGLNCGIMDHMTAVLGKMGHALFLDCRSLKYDLIRLPPSMRVIVMDTSSRRELVDTLYNERQQECKKAAEKLGIESLRDITTAQFLEQSRHLDLISLRRARHVTSENQRVVDSFSALLLSNLRVFGSLINKSHESLRDDFEVTNGALDALVAAAQQHPGCYGARMTGAGFGGCAIAVVRRGDVKGFTEYMAQKYYLPQQTDPIIHVCTPSQGVSLGK